MISCLMNSVFNRCCTIVKRRWGFAKGLPRLTQKPKLLPHASAFRPSRWWILSKFDNPVPSTVVDAEASTDWLSVDEFMFIYIYTHLNLPIGNIIQRLAYTDILHYTFIVYSKHVRLTGCKYISSTLTIQTWWACTNEGHLAFDYFQTGLKLPPIQNSCNSTHPHVE